MGTKMRLIFLSTLVLLLIGVVCGQSVPGNANLVNTPTSGAPGPMPPTGASIVQWGHDDTVVPRNIWGWTTGGGNATPYNSGYGICNGLTPGASTVSTAITPGMVMFGSSNYWHTDVSSAAIDPNSATILTYIFNTTPGGYYHPGTLTVSNVQITSGVMTVLGTAGNFSPTVGRTVIFAGTGLSWLDGATVTVTSVLGNGPADPNGSTTNGITTTVPSGAPSSYGPTATSGTATTTDTAPALGPNFGTAQGIPFTIDDSTNVPLTYAQDTYGMFQPLSTGADNVAAPIPSYLPIEGLIPDCYDPTGNTPGQPYEDAHAIILDKNTCWEYDYYQAVRCHGAWSAGGETVWDLTNYNQRPVGWSSVDAAGLPVLPGMLQHVEVAYGTINHAIRATVKISHDAYVYPATHWAGIDHTSGYNSPIPLGMRLRLKPSCSSTLTTNCFNMTGFSIQNQVILRALQTYGLIIADNGSNLFMTGTVDQGWNDNDLGILHKVTAGDFDIITMPPAYTVLNPGYRMTISGCTSATFLNGNTYTTTMTGRGWSQETAAITHADYPTTTDNCTVNFAFPIGSVFTLPGAWTATTATVNVTSNLLTLIWTVSDAGSNLPKGAIPVISSFTATPTHTAANGSVTLAWTYTNGTYAYLTQCDTGCPYTGSANPQVGVIRGASGSVTVTPAITTTYTLNVLNNLSQYGYVSQSVTVPVP